MLERGHLESCLFVDNNSPACNCDGTLEDDMSSKLRRGTIENMLCGLGWQVAGGRPSALQGDPHEKSNDHDPDGIAARYNPDGSVQLTCSADCFSGWVTSREFQLRIAREKRSEVITMLGGTDQLQMRGGWPWPSFQYLMTFDKTIPGQRPGFDQRILLDKNVSGWQFIWARGMGTLREQGSFGTVSVALKFLWAEAALLAEQNLQLSVAALAKTKR